MVVGFDSMEKIPSVLSSRGRQKLMAKWVFSGSVLNHVHSRYLLKIKEKTLPHIDHSQSCKSESRNKEDLRSSSVKEQLLELD
jgi:hypothetical protein